MINNKNEKAIEYLLYALICILMIGIVIIALS
jgi:hypothetical protein